MIDFVYSFIRFFIPSFIGLHVGQFFSEKYDFVETSIIGLVLIPGSAIIFMTDEDYREEYIGLFIRNFMCFAFLGLFFALINSFSTY